MVFMTVGRILSLMVALVGINLLYSYIIHSPLKLRASSRNIGSSSTGEYIDTAGELSDEEYAEVLAFAAGGDEAQEKEELNLKVKQAMEKEWDLKKGVITESIKESTKTQPIKANIDLLSYNARKELLRSNFTGAINLYEQCIDYNPRDGRPWLGLARIYWKKRNSVKAEKTYRDGLYYNPKNPFLLQAWAVMLEKLGRIPEAQKLLIKSVKSSPGHAASWCALGSLNSRKGEIGTARYCYSSAVEGDSKSYVALQAWGLLEESEGNIDLARDLFKRAVKMSNGRSVHSYHAWALLERKQGDLEKAKYLLTTALQKLPESTRIRLSLAELAELRGEIDEVRKLFSEGERSACHLGDAGFFQAWAMFELRELQQLEYESRKKEKGTGADAKRSDADTDTYLRIGWDEASLDPSRDAVSMSVHTEEENQASATTSSSTPTLSTSSTSPAPSVFTTQSAFTTSSADSNFESEVNDVDDSTSSRNNERSSGSFSGSTLVREEETIESLLESELDEEQQLDVEIHGVVARAGGRALQSTRRRDKEIYNNIYIENGQHYEKIAFIRRLFKTAVTINKYHSASWVGWAKFEQKAGNLDVAHKLLIAGISNFPHSKNIAWFHSSLGHLSRQQGDIITSRACYQRAVDTSPPQKSLPVLLEFARMETFHGSVKEAAKVLELARRRFPGNRRVEMAEQDLNKGKQLERSRIDDILGDAF